MKLDHINLLRRAVLLAPVVGALGGCMTSSPIWDAHFGEAVRATTQAQILDPQAGERNPSTQGINGSAAVSAMQRYDKSFVAPAQTSNPFVIGIGAGSGAASQ
jgi:hypothetical protein